ncbi:MAG: zinc-dependent peptidase [Actinobacteria bacterium]|nr:zinc-dependent peptidase [Actinomycetota bacterium]
MLGRWSQKRHALDEPFPDEWRALLSERVVHWNMLDDAEREQLEDLIRVFLADKRWESAHRFALTDTHKVCISAMACLLLLGLDYDYFHKVKWIQVHPTTVILQGTRATGVQGVVTDSPFPILGEADYEGPVVIAWDSARESATHPERGHNVVYHEFAHKLDMADGLVDGTPPLSDRAETQRWIDVCTREYEALRDGRGGPILDPYGGVNPGEFFAVATELFFDRPIDMQAQKLELYDCLAGFYQQDPAERERRAHARR